jgi:hypothetical protein
MRAVLAAAPKSHGGTACGGARGRGPLLILILILIPSVRREIKIKIKIRIKRNIWPLAFGDGGEFERSEKSVVPWGQIAALQ